MALFYIFRLGCHCSNRSPVSVTTLYLLLLFELCFCCTFTCDSRQAGFEQQCWEQNIPSHSEGMLPSIYSYSLGLAVSTIRLARTLLPGETQESIDKEREGAGERAWKRARERRCAGMMQTQHKEHSKHKETVHTHIYTHIFTPYLTVLSDTHTHTHTHSHKCARSCAQTHTHTHTNTHTRTHAQMTVVWQAMDDYLVALGPFSSDLFEWLQIWAKPLCKSVPP